MPASPEFSLSPLTRIPTGQGLWMAQISFPSPSWLHKAFHSQSQPSAPCLGAAGKWKESALEEEAEAQLMVPNSGRHVSGWKNQPGSSWPPPQ